MRALTIKQPGAHLIVTGAKPIENRSWPTRLRGRIWIHAAAKLDFDCPPEIGRQLPDVANLPLGCLLGAVEIIDCLEVDRLPVSLRRSPHAGGPWCWILREPQCLEGVA
jgi:hypothetical protein